MVNLKCKRCKKNDYDIAVMEEKIKKAKQELYKKGYDEGYADGIYKKEKRVVFLEKLSNK